jgi:hypothetical protein
MKTLRRLRVLRKVKRTRKHKIRGGMYVCDISNKKSMNDCINDYIAQNNFTKVETADDGNCFFDTLSKFYELNGIEKSHSELRKELIKYMHHNLHDIAAFISSRNDPLETIKELSKNGAWCSDLGDSVPSIATRAFKITIIIHDVRQKKGAIPRHIQTIQLDPEGINSEYIVNVLRNKNHYELLSTENNSALAPAPVPPSANSNKNNNNGLTQEERNLIKQVKELSMYNQ